MSLYLIKAFFVLFSSLSFLLQIHAAPLSPLSLETKDRIPTTQASQDWHLIREKNFPFYKVQLFKKETAHTPDAPPANRLLVTDPQGNVKAEFQDYLIQMDPSEFVTNWVAGMKFDANLDGYEDLIIHTFSGGAHCCNSYQIFSLGKAFAKIGDLNLLDCGETIQLFDYSGTKHGEILSCNADFTYLKTVSFALSPFPPRIFGMENGKFINQDKKYPNLFKNDIDKQTQLLKKGFSEASALQIVVDYLLLGQENEAWREFDHFFSNHKNKEILKKDLQERWNKQKLKPESQAIES